MGRIGVQETVEAAKDFKEEILEIIPDIPRGKLSEMVDRYVHYQQAEVGKDEAHRTGEETCTKKWR